MSKITESARMQECTVMIPGYCNYNPETTVFGHLPGGGMGRKRCDLFGAYICSACHDVSDGRVRTNHSGMQITFWFFEGVLKTQKILLEKGLIEIK